MSDFFSSVLDFFFQILDLLHTGLEPIFGVHAWGWSIIALTLVVRVALLPLAIKQTRSMRAMQALQPQIKELQKKYKVDRDLMRKDPETYRARRQKLSEEQMALFKREGANPAASCLPILAQAPIFIALFWMLRGQSERGEPLFDAPFYFFTSFITQDSPADPPGLAALVSSAGWPGWLLIVLMSGSMFITSRQMMARNAAMGTDGAMSQQMQMQKMLMYVMPVFLAVISFQFPLGILLYWVTTNVWQIAQQWVILREVKHEVETGEIANKPGGQAAARNKPQDGKKPRRSPGASSGRGKIQPGDDVGGSLDGDDAPAKGAGSKKGESNPPKGPDKAGDKGSKDTNGSKPAGGKASGGANGKSRSGGAGSEGGSGRARNADHLPRRRGGTS